MFNCNTEKEEWWKRRMMEKEKRSRGTAPGWRSTCSREEQEADYIHPSELGKH